MAAVWGCTGCFLRLDRREEQSKTKYDILTERIPRFKKPPWRDRVEGRNYWQFELELKTFRREKSSCIR